MESKIVQPKIKRIQEIEWLTIERKIKEIRTRKRKKNFKNFSEREKAIMKNGKKQAKSVERE